MGTDLIAGLTEQEHAFVQSVVAGAELQDAARAAGYATNLPVAAWRLVRRPRVAAAILTETRLRLISLAPKAVNVYEIAVNGNKVPKSTMDAAHQILARSGLIPPKASDAEKSSDIPLNELSLDELRRRADRLEAAIAERARVVEALPGDNAPNVPAYSGEAIDIPE